MRGFVLFGLLCIAGAIGGSAYEVATADHQILFAILVLMGLVMDVGEFFKRLMK